MGALVDAGDALHDDAGFAAFVASTGIALHRALAAGYGSSVGGEAYLDALAWGWAHRARLAHMRNPAGYLYRVGQTSARRQLRRVRREQPVARVDDTPTPGADEAAAIAVRTALDGLTSRQRTAVVLTEGFGYPLAEVASLMGCGVSTVRNHRKRALEALRIELGEGQP